MNGLVSSILKLGDSLLTEAEFRREVSEHLDALRASAGRGDRRIVQQLEEHIRRSPQQAFQLDGSGNAWLTMPGKTWCAGKFHTPSILELKEKVKNMRSTTINNASARLRLWVLDGASPATDIGALQATSSESLFQVASQFNCLEAPGPEVTAVMNYFYDYTQGPRASISAFPGTFLRHYYAPGKNGARFAQVTNGDQIDLLEFACKGLVKNGYVTGRGVSDPHAAISRLETNFDKICVGLHDNVQVALGYNWDGAVAESDDRRIAQVFTSTVAGGGYDGRINLGERAFTAAATTLLGACYLGTLLATVCTGRKVAVLTLIGGGVFQNPIRLIWNSILWAVDTVNELLPADLDVILNGYNLGRLMDLNSALPAIRQRHGALIRFGDNGVLNVTR